MGESFIKGLGSDEVFGLALAWIGEGRSVAVATVIETWGSAPCRPGSRLLVSSDGGFAGSVSGGCIENAVMLDAVEAIRRKRQHRVLHFGVADEDAWEVGLACGGEIRVLVQPVGEDRTWTFGRMRERMRTRQAFACATDLDSGYGIMTGGDCPEPEEELAQALRESLANDRAGIIEIKGRRYFIEPFNPQPRLVIVGAVHIAQALAAIAAQCGYEPLIVDPRDSWTQDERFPGVTMFRDWPEEAFAEIGLDARTAVAALTHDPKIDDPALQLALASPACYVGALGSPRTHASRLERLRDEGVSEEQCARIVAPIGLDIGAATPVEIALSVMAQVVSKFRGGARRQG